MSMIIRIVNVLSITAIYMFLSACSDEASTEQTDVLGSPPRVAYLGVEYYYNFGSLGGLDIHNYSLSNNPTWLSLEQTDNKARQGVIVSGVPGITGGRRGELDVEKNDDVRLSANDGSNFGGYSWNIEVKNNEIEVFAPEDPEEGKATVRSGGNDTSDECPYPDTSKKRINVNGIDYVLYPVISEVVLTQPSVEKISVTYTFTSSYAEEAEDGEADTGNRSRARVNHDFIIDYDAQSPENAPFYEALRNATDGYTPGVVTFEPGVTKCYIRTYLNNDFIAEREEGFNVRLEEVIEGIAVLGSQRSDLINIVDNEPVASFKEDHILALNEGDTHTYTLVLDKAPGYYDYDAEFPESPVGINVVVTLQELEKKLLDVDNAALVDDYILYTWDQGNEEPADLENATTSCVEKVGGVNVTGEKGSVVTIPFSGDETEKKFRICLLNNGDEDSGEDDHLIFEVRDDIASLSATPADEVLEVYINEWVNEVSINESRERVIDIVRDGAFNVILLGEYTLDSGEYFLRTFSSHGSQLGEDIPFTYNAEGNAQPIGIAQTQFANPDQNTKDDTDNFVYRIGVLAKVGSDDASEVLVVAFDRVSNEENYSYSWELLFGSDAKDTPIGIHSREGSFYIYGNTEGDWQREKITGLSDKWKDQTSKGNGDVFVSKVSYIDTELNLGNDEDEENEKEFFTAPLNEWTTVVGSDFEDVAANISLSASQVLLAGATAGSLSQDGSDEVFSNLGQMDMFAFRLSQIDGNISTLSQFGTTDNDVPTSVSSGIRTVISTSGYIKPFSSTEDQDETEEGEESEGSQGSTDLDILRVTLGFNFNVESVLRFGTRNADDSVYDELSIDRENFFVGTTAGTFNEEDIEYLRNDLKENNSDSAEEDDLEAEEFEFIRGLENQGATDLFIASTTNAANSANLEDVNWVYQFGSALEDEFIHLGEVNPVKLMMLTKEGGEYKINMFSTKGYFLTDREGAGSP